MADYLMTLLGENKTKKKGIINVKYNRHEAC